jgi:uncharacterized membrane protein YbhN (UPF0104 family)
MLLVREAQSISWDDFVAGVTGIAPLDLLLAATLIGLNYFMLFTYDLLALRHIKQSLPVRRVALVGFLGYALGNNLGTLVAATPLRFRLYTAWGLKAKQITAIVVILGLAFWSGVFWLGGIVLIAVPIPVPPEVSLPFSTEIFGWALLAAGMVLAATSLFWRRPLPLGAVAIRPPAFSLLALITTVAMMDLTVSALALYLVLPSQSLIPFATLLAAYLIGITASLVTQVPGGLVVLELILLKMLSSSVGKTVIGSLLIYRLLYYVAPLIVAVILLVVYEVRSTREKRLRMRRTQHADKTA